MSRACLLADNLLPSLSKAGTRMDNTGATTVPRAQPYGVLRALIAVPCPRLRLATRQSLTALSPCLRLLNPSRPHQAAMVKRGQLLRLLNPLRPHQAAIPTRNTGTNSLALGTSDHGP